MTPIHISDLDEATLGQLKELAAKNGRTIEAEVKAILLQTLPKIDRWVRTRTLHQELERSGRQFPDSTPLIREDRER